jgi:hypothetical protein
MEEQPKFNLTSSTVKLSSNERTLPQAGGGTIDTEFDRIIGLDRKYHYFGGEEPKAHETRDRLLGHVSVNDHGIAISATDAATTRVVAFRVSGYRAIHVPFVQGENELLLPLPETGSQIGFFVEDTGETPSDATLRQGDYPGIPLATGPHERKVGDTMVQVAGERHEMTAVMHGIQDQDALLWKSDINLESFGFDPERTRELLGMRYATMETDEFGTKREVTTRPLLILPSHMRDLADHYDSLEVTRDVLQLITLEGIPRKQTEVPHIPWDNNHNIYELGIGLGRATTTPDKSLQINTKQGDMRSAFQIRIVPQQ